MSKNRTADEKFEEWISGDVTEQEIYEKLKDDKKSEIISEFVNDMDGTTISEHIDSDARVLGQRLKDDFAQFIEERDYSDIENSDLDSAFADDDVDQADEDEDSDVDDDIPDPDPAPDTSL